MTNGPWLYTFNVAKEFDEFEDLGFEESRDRLVTRIRTSEFYKDLHAIDHGSLRAIVDELDETNSLDDFNDIWDILYDWCDRGKTVWIETILKEEAEKEEKT